MLSIAHAGMLAALKQITRPYRSGPLPEWDVFAASTGMVSLQRRQRLEAGRSDVFLIGSGLVKMTDPKRDDRVEEFFPARTVVAPLLRPAWAESSGAPMTNQLWRRRGWSLGDFEI